ncbi:MAG: hypothetical protein K6D61_06120 [Prevotella sp.]|nr:hypothetical protein [Prevotella sp.]
MKRITVKRTRTVRVMNDYHIKVKKCCASCQFKEIDEEGNRICSRMQLMRGQHDKCPLWVMSEGLMNAGMSGGRVKKLTIVVIK